MEVVKPAGEQPEKKKRRPRRTPDYTAIMQRRIHSASKRVFKTPVIERVLHDLDTKDQGSFLIAFYKPAPQRQKDDLEKLTDTQLAALGDLISNNAKNILRKTGNE
jgi:hypothetical protein